MSQHAVNLLIKSRPLWHTPDPAQMPVLVTTVFTVMGRRMGKWTTILMKTDDLHAARYAMDAANTSGLFDRVVIAEGRSVNSAPADKWETIECAVPFTPFVSGDSFDDLLGQMKHRTANINPMFEIEKQSYAFLLALACVLGTIHMSPVILCGIAIIACADTIFLANRQPLRSTMTNTIRHWSYAILNGVLLWPLVLKILS